MIHEATQDQRHLAVMTIFGEDQLLLRRFTGREQLSGLFEFNLELLAAEPLHDPAELVGTELTFLVDREEGDPRYFNGCVANMSQLEQTELATTYVATVVPRLWFLTKSTDCRIFQDLTTPQIIEQVFRGLNLEHFDLSGLKGDYARRSYCVQYRESDFNFVSRLMEEEGIYYFFRHENGVHTLVLADSPASYFPIHDQNLSYLPPSKTDACGDHINRWERQVEFRPGRWSQVDYDFKKPRTRLHSEAAATLPHQSFLGFEMYDFPGRFDDTDLGKTRTRIRMEEAEVRHDTVSGTANYRTLTPGGMFSVKEHPSASEIGKRHVLTEVTYDASVGGTYVAGSGDAGELTYSCQFRCIPAEIPFRPPWKSRKPVVEGPQTAVVVGPTGEEIFTDEHARVKCQFHWDRNGRFDDRSSCWMRVSQEHAGKGWGSIDLPRVGEEVIVAFLEGDPDRPIIKGRVYNAEATPPFDLSGSSNATNKTRRGGTTKTYRGSGSNEMTMDDTPGQEQLRINAQYNMDANVNNNESLDVAVDRSADVGNNEAQTVAVDSSADVGNDQSTTVGNDSDVIAGSNVVIEAGTAITLACGASTIHMNQAGVIMVSGSFVSSIAKANNSIVAPKTDITGSDVLLQAGLVVLDLGGVNHNKGNQVSAGGVMVDVRGATTLLQGQPLQLIPPAPPASTGGGASGGGAGSAEGGAGCGTGSAGGDAGQPGGSPDQDDTSFEEGDFGEGPGAETVDSDPHGRDPSAATTADEDPSDAEAEFQEVLQERIEELESEPRGETFEDSDAGEMQAEFERIREEQAKAQSESRVTRYESPDGTITIREYPDGSMEQMLERTDGSVAYQHVDNDFNVTEKEARPIGDTGAEVTTRTEESTVTERLDSNGDYSITETSPDGTRYTYEEDSQGGWSHRLETENRDVTYSHTPDGELHVNDSQTHDTRSGSMMGVEYENSTTTNIEAEFASPYEEHSHKSKVEVKNRTEIKVGDYTGNVEADLTADADASGGWFDSEVSVGGGISGSVEKDDQTLIEQEKRKDVGWDIKDDGSD